MPIPAALGSLWQLKIVGRQEGQETNNVFHFSNVGVDSDATLHLVKVFADCFINNLLPVLSSAWAMEKVTYQQIGPTLGPSYDYVPTGTLTGGANALVLPSTSAVVFSERGLRGGRSRRGRFSIAGIPEGATDGSKLNPDHEFYIACVAFAACLISNFRHPDPAGGSAIYDLVIYSRKIGGDHFPPTGSDYLESVSEITPQLVIGTMRSRKLGRGV